jgi:tRNA modification GTPase
MFSPDDTIVAIATPLGRGALGVVRLSGPLARQVAGAIVTRPSALQPRVAVLTRLRASGPAPSAGAISQDGAAISDQVIVTWFPSPHSYTGQDVVEISAHGSPVVLRSIVQAAMNAGARLAQPGEFTLRAFLAGKLDLVQAEAVGDLIAAATPLQARVAFDQLEGTLTLRIAEVDAELFDLVARLEASLDFPDEGYHFVEPAAVAERIGAVIEGIDRLLADAARGRMIRDGATVVVAGRPNVGKSSIFNALAGADRAIVTPVAGTTRDLVTESVDIGGVAVTLVDTAGTRDALDLVEREGISRGAQARTVADLVVLVVDGSEPLAVEDLSLLAETAGRPRVIVSNKADRPNRCEAPNSIKACALTGDGMDLVRTAIAETLLGTEALRDTAIVTNARHVSLLRSARDHLAQARDAASGGVGEEFLLSDLQAARARFDEIVGTRTTEDVLQHIFERFCIGK